MKLRVLQHLRCEGMGVWGGWAEEEGVDLAITCFEAGDPCPILKPGESLLVLGGSMNVDEVDRYPFLQDEVRLLRRAFGAEVPTLGVCLGAQLLAKALGAPVVRSPHREIGWSTVTLTHEAELDMLFKGLPKELPVFQWHGDTFRLPVGATHLAESPLCNHQAFRKGPWAYGIQFHLEVEAVMVRDWSRQYAAEAQETLTAEGVRKMIEESPARAAEVDAASRRLWENFRALCERRWGS